MVSTWPYMRRHVWTVLNSKVSVAMLSVVKKMNPVRQKGTNEHGSNVCVSPVAQLHRHVCQEFGIKSRISNRQRQGRDVGSSLTVSFQPSKPDKNRNAPSRRQLSPQSR